MQDVLEYSIQKKMEYVAVKLKNISEPEEALVYILGALWETRKYLKRLKEAKNIFMIEDKRINLLYEFLKS